MTIVGTTFTQLVDTTTVTDTFNCANSKSHAFIINAGTVSSVVYNAQGTIDFTSYVDLVADVTKTADGVFFLNLENFPLAGVRFVMKSSTQTTTTLSVSYRGNP